MLHSRSSEDADGGDPVEAVTAHQVGDVVLDLHLLTGEPGSLEELSFGRGAVLKGAERDRKAGRGCVCFWICRPRVTLVLPD